ncbi:MAG: DUF4396 domain-containing protein [Chthoniobacterales bacterium]
MPGWLHILALTSLLIAGLCAAWVAFEMWITNVVWLVTALYAGPLAVTVLSGHEIGKTNPVFWFMMQVAMLAGFPASYPMNSWLLRAGLKEAM